MVISIGDLELFNQETITLRQYNCKQFLIFSAVPDSGVWSLTFDGQTTGNLAYDISAAALKTALELLSTIDEISVTGDFSIGFTIEFQGTQANEDQNLITIASNSLLIITISVIIEIYFTGRGEDLAGNYNLGESVDSDINANVQPLTGKEITQLEEYDHTKEHWNIFTKTALVIRSSIIKDLKEYEINKVEEWYGYYKALMIEVRPA